MLLADGNEAFEFSGGSVQSVRVKINHKGTTVRTSKDAAFGSDATQIRAVSRVGFGFANPAGVVRLYGTSA